MNGVQNIPFLHTNSPKTNIGVQNTPFLHTEPKTK